MKVFDPAQVSVALLIPEKNGNQLMRWTGGDLKAVDAVGGMLLYGSRGDRFATLGATTEGRRLKVFGLEAGGLIASHPIEQLWVAELRGPTEQLVVDDVRGSVHFLSHFAGTGAAFAVNDVDMQTGRVRTTPIEQGLISPALVDAGRHGIFIYDQADESVLRYDSASASVSVFRPGKSALETPGNVGQRNLAVGRLLYNPSVGLVRATESGEVEWVANDSLRLLDAKVDSLRGGDRVSQVSVRVFEGHPVIVYGLRPTGEVGTRVENILVQSLVESSVLFETAVPSSVSLRPSPKVDYVVLVNAVGGLLAAWHPRTGSLHDLAELPTQWISKVAIAGVADIV